MTGREARKYEKLNITAAAAEASRRIRVEMQEGAKPCRGPFCINRRPHRTDSGKCKFAPKPTAEKNS